MEKASQQDKEAEPKLKVFQANNKNRVILDEYSDNLGEEYWKSWEKSEYCPHHSKSWISPEKLRLEADRLGMKEELKLEEIIQTLENGADLGIIGEGRWPSHGPNSPSAYEFVARLADSMQSANKSRSHVGAFYRSRDAMGGI